MTMASLNLPKLQAAWPLGFADLRLIWRMPLQGAARTTKT